MSHIFKSRILSLSMLINLTVLVFSCLSECGSGERVFWLFVPQRARLYQRYSRISESSNGIEFPVRFSTEDATSASPIRRQALNEPFFTSGDHEPLQEFDERSIYFSKPTPISPLFITEYESEGWQRKRNHEPNYNNLVVMDQNAEEFEDDASGSSELGLDKISLLDQSTELNLLANPSSGAISLANKGNQCLMEGGLSRYDPLTDSCYTVGTRGPCGNYMIFVAMPENSPNGYCDCDYGSYDRPLAYIGGKCHFLYTQGVCYPGFWLTSDAQSAEPICRPNPCPAQADENAIVLFMGECVRLQSSSRHCRREGEVVLFPKGSNEPACGFPKSTRRIFRRQISNVNPFLCPLGTRRHRMTKKCIKTKTRAIVFAR